MVLRSRHPPRVGAWCLLLPAALLGWSNVSSGDDGGYPQASKDCEAVVKTILDEWQATIDDYRDVDLGEFLAGERVYNLTEVPIGSEGCASAEATTLATDRAGTLVAETAVAAFARGIILSDVVEMHFFGPGLDPDAPIATDLARRPPDLDELADAAPDGDATCAAWAEHAVAVIQANIDLVATMGRALLFEPQRMDDSDLSQVDMAQGLLRETTARGEDACGRRNLALEMAGRWAELEATGLLANVWLGGMTDNFYPEFMDALAKG